MGLEQFYTPDSSFFEAEKFGNLSAKQEQKAGRLLGALTPSPTPSVGSSLIDMMQSSGLRELGDVADAGVDVAGYFGLGDGAKLNEGYSNKEISDAAAGVDPRTRDLQTGYENQVLTDVAQGNWTNLPKSIYDAAPGLAADSAGTAASGIAGVGATAGIGALAGLAFGPGGAAVGGLAGAGVGLASKADNVYDSISSMMKRYDKVKTGLKTAGKHVAQTGVMVAADTERQIQEYRQENNGAYPPPENLTAMAVGSSIVMSAQLGIGKSFFKSKDELSKLDAMLAASKPTKSSTRKIIGSLGEGLAKVSVTGGEEAAQEYVQQWQQILSKNVDVDSGQSVWDSVKAELSNPDNQLDTKVAAALGFGAGGATRAAAVSPGVVGRVARDTVIGTTKSTYGVAKDAISGTLNHLGGKTLSEEEKRDLSNQYANETVLIKQKSTDLKRQRDIINNATSLESLKADSEVAKQVSRYQRTERPDVVKDEKETDEEFNLRVESINAKRDVEQASSLFSDEALKDKTTFKKFKQILINNNKKFQKGIQDDLEASSLSHFESKSGSPNLRNVEPPTQEQTDALVASVTPHGEATIQAARELETNLAIDTVTQIAKDATIVSKEALRQAKELSVYDLERVAAIVSKTNPATASKLQRMAASKGRALDRFNPDKNKIIDDANIDKDLMYVAENGIDDEAKIPSISKQLSSTMHKKLKSPKAVKVMQEAIKHYENSQAFKKQGKGVIHPSTINKWKKRLAIMEKTVKDSPESTPEAKVSENVKDTTTEVKETPTGVAALSDEELSKERDSGKTEYAYDDIVNEIDKRKKAKLKEENEKVTNPEAEGAESSSNVVEARLQQLTNIVEAASNNKDMDLSPVLKKIPSIAKVLKGAGYKTNKDFENLITQYPTLKKNAEVYNLLKLEMYNPEEEADNIATKELTSAQYDAAYDELFPGCRK